MAETVKCSKGHENPFGDNFCRTCGERLSGGQIKCPSCGAINNSDANFCGKCGKSLKVDHIADIEGTRWRRGVEDFATRVDVEDLPGVLKKGIIVEQGTKALLFIDGALAEILQPGRYDLGGLASKLKNFDPYRTSTAILVDAGDVELDFSLTGIYTKDPLNIDITCKVITQIENPTFFFNNVMKGRRSYLTNELKSSVQDEMQNAFNEAVGKKSVTDLNWDLSLKRQFEVSVENHLRTTFQRTGLNFIQLRTIDYRFKGYDRIRGGYEEIFLLVSDEEAKLQKRKRLFDVFDKDQLQDIFEDTRKADYYEKRIDVFKKIKSLDMDKIRTEDEFEAFILEIDKGKMLRADEVEALKNTFAQSGLRREFLLKKIDLEQEIEYEGLRLVGKEEVELKRYEVEAKRKRMEFDEEIRGYLEKARAEDEVERLKRKAEQEELDMGLAALERVKDIKIQEKRKEMEVEVDRLERLSKLGVQALISASGEEQARLIVDLQKTEQMKGMTRDQILAMGAKDSPALAKAFEEMFKALSSDKLEQLYKEMIADKDKSMKMIQEILIKALETQKDVSVAAAQQRGPTTVYPPGQAGVVFPSVATVGQSVVKLFHCPKCKAEVPFDQEFCQKCGNKLI